MHVGVGPPPPARQVGQRQPKPPSRHGDQGGGGGDWANGLPCHPPPRKAIFFPPWWPLLQMEPRPRAFQQLSVLCEKSLVPTAPSTDTLQYQQAPAPAATSTCRTHSSLQACPSTRFKFHTSSPPVAPLLPFGLPLSVCRAVPGVRSASATQATAVVVRAREVPASVGGGCAVAGGPPPADDAVARPAQGHSGDGGVRFHY